MVGPNGSGKSTLVEAMAWALFGNEEEITRADKKSIIHQGAGKGEKCEVSMEFELDGKPYRVFRMMSASGAVTASLESDGRSLAEGAVPVTDQAARLLGMDYKAFFVSVFARQKELNALSRQTAGERRATVMRLLGIEAIDAAIAAARKDLGVAKENTEFQRRQLVDQATGEEILPIRREEAKGIEAEQNAIAGRIATLETSLKSSREKVGELEAILKKSGEAKSKHDAIDRKRESLTQSVEVAARDLKRMKIALDEIADAEKALERAEASEARFAKAKAESEELAKIEKLLAERTRLEEQIEGKKGRLGELTKEMKKSAPLEKEMKELSKKVEALQNERDSLRGKIASEKEKMKSLGAELKALEKRYEELSAVGEDSKCPTCERPLKDHYESLLKKTRTEASEKEKAIDSISQSLSSLDEDEGTARARTDALDKRKAALEKSLKSCERLAGESEALTEEIGKIANSLDAVQGKIKSSGAGTHDETRQKELRKELAKLEKAHEDYIGLKKTVEAKPKLEKETAASKANLSKVEGQLKAATEELKSVSFDNGAHVELEKNVKAARDESQEIALSLERAKGGAGVLRAKVDALAKDIARLETIQGSIGELEQQREYLAKAVELLDEFKKHMVARIRPALASATSRLLDLLSAGRYSQVEISDDYGVKVYDGGVAYGLERFSGGEEDMVNICLRLAISQLIAERGGLSGLNMVVLDEIFGSQDMERRRSILTALNGLSNVFKQIILITHIEDVRDSVNGVITVEMAAEGTSSARLI